MKKLLLLLLLILPGCGGVQLSPEYKDLLHQNVLLSQKYATDAPAMTNEQAVEALKINASWWLQFEVASNDSN